MFKSRMKRAAALVIVALWAMTTALTATTPASAAPTPLPTSPTRVAATKLCGNCGDDMVVIRGANRRIYWTYGSNSYTAPGTWSTSGWREITGGGLTDHAPALATSGQTVHAVVVGLDGRVFLNNYDGHQWLYSSWFEIPGNGRLIDAPTAVSGSNGTLTVFGRGQDNGIWYQQYNNGWSTKGWRKIPGGAQTASAVAAVQYAGVLQVVVRGSDNRVWTGSSAYLLYTGEWLEQDGFELIPGGGRITHAPAVTLSYTSPQVMHVLGRGTAGDVWYQSQVQTCGTPTGCDYNWNSGWAPLPGTGRTSQAPAAGGFGPTVNAYIIGTDNNSVWTEGVKPQGAPNYGPLIPAYNHGWVKVPGSTPPAPPTAPDLGWTAAPSYDCANDRITIPFKNVGNANAGAFRIGIIFNNVNYSDVVFNGMAAGQGDTVWINVAPLTPGVTYTYNFNLDSYNTVSESNEGNNSYNGYFTPVNC